MQNGILLYDRFNHYIRQLATNELSQRHPQMSSVEAVGSLLSVRRSDKLVKLVQNRVDASSRPIPLPMAISELVLRLEEYHTVSLLFYWEFHEGAIGGTYDELTAQNY